MSKEPLDEVNLRSYVEELWPIFLQNSHITQYGQPMRAIYEEEYIDLSRLAGALLLQVVFDIYQLGGYLDP